MLITEIKEKDSLAPLLKGNICIIRCDGCDEVSPLTEQAAALRADFLDGGKTALITTDYICGRDHLLLRLKKHADAIAKAETVLVFSCGVGVQTVAAEFPEKKVIAVCDTYPLPGFQGVTPLEHDCGRCGECYLNSTGGICPITSCAKSLVNGQCGGSKNGKCEVDSDMDCGWEIIYRRLEKLKQPNCQNIVRVRNYAAGQSAN